jgi:hypothetical protein
MRTFLAVGALAAAGLLAAGCSSGSTPATSSTAGAGAVGAGANDGPNAKTVYISCLVSHGVRIQPRSAGNNGGVNRNSPQFRRAEQACKSLQPAGTQAQQITAQDQTYYLRAVQCMRSRGVPNFPDPVFTGGGVHFAGPPPGLNLHSPQVLRAEAICRRLIPAGLPYSR